MGGTLGKLALGLKVVKEGGEKVDWQASIIRNPCGSSTAFSSISWARSRRTSRKQRLATSCATLVVPK